MSRSRLFVVLSVVAMRRLAIALLLSTVLPRLAEAQEMEAKKGAPKPDAAAKALGVDPERLAALNEEQMLLAKTVGRDLVCLCGTCPKEPIADCTCGWAHMSRRTIQAAVAKGMGREQIVDFYAGVYGDQVRAMIPKKGFANAAWILPYTAAVVGLLLVLIVGLRYKKRSSQTEAIAMPTPEQAPGPGTPDDARRQLARELEEMD